MEQKKQNKWEEWAATLHDKKEDGSQFIQGDDVQDKKAVHRIFEVRGKVNTVLGLKNVDQAWNSLHRDLKPRSSRRVYLRYASILILSLLLSGATYWLGRYAQFSNNSYATISSPNGQITNFTLFDGTNVWLNAGSTIRYAQSFNRSERTVYLEGEALFDVTKNAKRPFLVETGIAQIKVAGTKFNVRAYTEENTIETVLIEGEVHFLEGSRTLVLSPGERVQLTKESGAISKARVNTSEYTSWHLGKHHFNDESLSDLVLLLERWYDIKFAFESDSIKAYRFSGVIDKERSLDYTLNIIEEINRVKFERKDDQIMIKAK